MTKKFDPLWELVGEELPLQGAFDDVDALCPYCHVKLHVGTGVEPGSRFTCGLCGTEVEVDTTSGQATLTRVTE